MFTSKHLLEEKTPKRTIRRRGYCALSLMVVALSGCVQKMDDQPKLEVLETSDMFRDGRASRDAIIGTVARGERPDEITTHSTHYLTGTEGGEPVTQLPAEIAGQFSMQQLLERGQERYAIFCAHCHDLQGGGQGIVPQRGFSPPPTFHSNRMRAVSLGHIYRVISHGRGRMPAHGGQIPPDDRWAIAAYVRALQWSQHADAGLLPGEDLERLHTTNSIENQGTAQQ